jgi:hypothetical protein
MGWCRSVRVLALGAIVFGTLAVGAVKAGSVWFVLDPDEIVCDVLGTETCAIEIAWSVGNADRFEKWKICWKPKDFSTWLDDHCSYHSRLVDIEDDAYAIPGLDLGGYYRIKLEGRRERNGKWTCLHKAMIRSVGYAARLGNGGICTDF